MHARDLEGFAQNEEEWIWDENRLRNDSASLKNCFV